LDALTVRANARTAAVDVAKLYRNGDQSSVTLDPINDITFGKVSWNTAAQTYQFTWGDAAVPHNVVKVRASRSTTNGDNRLPLIFAPVFGTQKADIKAEAIATFQPRDMVVVLDYSASMRFDSTFLRASVLGRSFIESNLQTMWTELGSPVYGNLTFAPKYATLKGVAASGSVPHVDVTYKRSSVDVVSTSTLTQVKLQFSNGSTQTLSGLSGKTGTFTGNGNDITSCWVKSGGNSNLSTGSLGEQFDFTAANIKTALGLTTTYPYPSGSWDEYIQVVQTAGTDMANCGYRDMYGYMTWIEYLQTNHPYYSDTPDLWKTSEQPVGAMKDAVTLFMDFLKQLQTQDQIGLAVYSHPSTDGAFLEHGLSTNLDQIKTTTRQRQAGHYMGGTNIGAGMKVARQRSYRMMVVMTDGVANLPNNTTIAKQFVIDEANLAAANKIKILTISLGVLADKALMQQVADTTGGVHFNVPGGIPINDVRTQLQDVFREIAGSRPLKLISGQ
jgi:hypothetical protein